MRKQGRRAVEDDVGHNLTKLSVRANRPASIAGHFQTPERRRRGSELVRPKQANQIRQPLRTVRVVVHWFMLKFEPAKVGNLREGQGQGCGQGC